MRSSVRGVLAAGAGALLLVSCGGGPEEARRPEPGRAPPRAAVSDVPVKIGAPYTVGGATYTPQDDVDYDQVGYASWYGQELSGNDTANGETFVPEGVTAAHRTLPLPSYVEVTALDTGRTILVRVNDRGPFSGDRLIDLSQGAAQQLGIMGHGATPVRVRRVNPPEQERAALRAHRGAAPRMDAPPQLLAGLAERLPRGAVPVVRPKPAPVASATPAPSPGGYMVQVAAFSSRDRAQELAKRIGARAIEAKGIWRVRYGPYADTRAARQGVDLAASKGYADARIVANDSP